MRVGPSGSDGRVRAQTTGSCSGTTAGVVSVHGKGGTKPVRCVLGRRRRVNRRQRVESEWMPSKPGSDQWPGRSPGEVLLRCPGGGRHKGGVSPAQALVRNAGTCAAMSREISKWRTHEEPSTDAWLRDERARRSDEAR